MVHQPSEHHFPSPRHHHQGHCLLFTSGEWRENDGQFVPEWASQAYCNFTIFVGVVMFVISATQVSLSVTMITLITMISRSTG